MKTLLILSVLLVMSFFLYLQDLATNDLVKELRYVSSEISERKPQPIWIVNEIIEPKKRCKSFRWCYVKGTDWTCEVTKPDIKTKTVVELCETTR